MLSKSTFPIGKCTIQVSQHHNGASIPHYGILAFGKTLGGQLSYPTASDCATAVSLHGYAESLTLAQCGELHESLRPLIAVEQHNIEERLLAVNARKSRAPRIL